MCGIAGFYNLYLNNFQVDEKLLNFMQKKLSHRGPDDFGIWKSDEDQIGFAHRRLSIVDLSIHGHQPMLDKQKTVAIVFNGEIYNHKDLRKELENLGYKYFSDTDTETLIYAYKEYGIDFLYKIEGMFSIAIFDLVKKELFLIRDRIGIKPLYFSLQGSILSFASEIKALWDLPWIKKKINQKAFYHYLTFMVSPAPLTIYDQIYKMPAGFYAKIDENKDIDFQQWYCPIKQISFSEKKEVESEDFCLERIEFLLKESTKKRMMSDVPFGAFLSGGIDSSLNVALMSQFISNVKTFTVAFSDGPEFNELKWARLISKKFGTQHNEIIISEKEAADFYEKMIYQLDEPLADCVCIPFYYVSKLAKDNGVTVAQVGEGADELFFGYDTYASCKKFYDYFWNPSKKIIPNFLKKFLYQTTKNIFYKQTKHLEILKNWAYDRDLFWGGAIAFNEHQKSRIFNFENKNFDQDNFINKVFKTNFDFSNYDSFVFVDYYLKKLKKLDPKADFIKQMTYLEFKQRLPELLLMRADKMSMSNSLEVRVPFLDHKLVEFLFNIPSRIKFKNGHTKYLLKKIAEKFLPKEVIYRKKVGFAAPTARWFKRGKYFPEHFQKLLNKPSLLVRHSLGDGVKLPASHKATQDTVGLINNNKNVLKSDLEKKYNAPEAIFAVQKWVIQNFFAQN